MALLHSWDFSVDPNSANCSIHSAHPWGEQSYSQQYGGTDRITAEALGGVNWSRQEVRVGDNNVSGSGGAERADIMVGTSLAGGNNGNIRSYRVQLLLRPAVDYDPSDGTVFNNLINFHRGGGGWPGATIMLSYCGNAEPEFNPQVPAVGALILQLWGGHVPALEQGGSLYNEEDYSFQAVGAWEGKALDIALRVKWANNSFDAGSTYFQSWNGGQPTNYANSGWIELQYRIGTVTSSISWGAWTWFDPALWTNGPDTRRHYRPTLFYFDDTGTSDSVYWKLANYRWGPGDGTSVVRYATPKIGETHTDVGAPEVSGAPATADPTEGPFGTTAVIDAFTGADLDPLPAPWTDDFSGGAHPSWKRASNAAAPSA